MATDPFQEDALRMGARCAYDHFVKRRNPSVVHIYADGSFVVCEMDQPPRRDGLVSIAVGRGQFPDKVDFVNAVIERWEINGRA